MTDMIHDSTTTYNAAAGYTITNTHVPGTISIKGTKVWDDMDDNDGKRPETITIQALDGDNEVAGFTVISKSETSWQISNLPEFKDGKRIRYTIQEVSVDGYQTRIEYDAAADSYTITNTP